jgi:hypothetical protein
MARVRGIESLFIMHDLSSLHLQELITSIILLYIIHLLGTYIIVMLLFR